MVVAALGLAGVVAGLGSTFLATAAPQWLFPLTLAVLVVLATWYVFGWRSVASPIWVSN
jgi:hypothetical protein